jgi:superfamily II DNA or RNA helicase
LIKKKKELSEYLSSIRFVIYDEAHVCPARSYYQIAHYISNVEFILGMTGTAFRDDGNDMYITAIAGNKIYELS